MAVKKAGKTATVVPLERVAQSILIIRSQKVMLDADLAELYGATTKRLNEQVKRNRARFPADFMFQLTEEEKAEVVANCDRLARLKFCPCCLWPLPSTAASVLNSTRAVEMSVFVVRAFIRLRQMLASNVALARKLAVLESKYDAQFKLVFEAIRDLMTPPEPKKKRPMGFGPWGDK